MKRTIDTFAGKPTGARRDRDGNITHMKFSRRIRATPIKTVYAVVQQKKAEGIKIVRSHDDHPKLVLDERIMGMESIEDLPEI